MAIIDTERDVIVIRIVYDGPPFSGKTTSIHTLGNLLGKNNPVFSPEESDGKTLYFDWMEYIGGLFKGYGISCQIISVPGQLSLEERRHFLLRTADAVIFVLDAGEKKTEIPLLYFKDLQNVLSLQPDEETVKVVIQANKQDKPNAFSSEQLKTEVFYNYPEIKIIESIATVGKGVRETFVLAVRHAIERADALMAKEQLASGKPNITHGEELLSVLQKTITLKPVTSDTDVIVQTQTKELSKEQLAEEPLVSFEDLDVSEPEPKSVEEHPIETSQEEQLAEEPIVSFEDLEVSESKSESTDKFPIETSIETSQEEQLAEEPLVSFEDLDVSEPEPKSVEEHPIETSQEEQLAEEPIVSFEDLEASESKSESTDKSPIETSQEEQLAEEPIVSFEDLDISESNLESVEKSPETSQDKQLAEEPIVSFEDLEASEPESKAIEEQLIETSQRANNSIIIENENFLADETQEPVNQLLEQFKEQPVPENLDLSRTAQELIETIQSDDIIEPTWLSTEEVKEPVETTLEQSPEPTTPQLLSFDELNPDNSQDLPVLENQSVENTEPPVSSKDKLEVESVNLSNEETTNFVEEENTGELPESTMSLNQNEIEDMKFVIVSDKEVDGQNDPTSDDEFDDEVEKFVSDAQEEESFLSGSDDELYISDEEFEEYISFDGEFKESSLFDQEFFVLPDELEKTFTLPDELEGVDDDVLPENDKTEPVNEINLPPPIEVKNQPDPILPTEGPNQSVSPPWFPGKKQLPKFPDEDTPIQWIWPPLSGSQILENLFKQALRPHLRPDGTWVINTKNDWRCFSKWHWSYTTAEQARERLRANMRMHLQCSPFLSEQRCVAIAYDALKETWRLWQIVRMELSLAEYLVEALQEERVEKLVLETIKCASYYVEALQQSTCYPPLLELSLENIGLDEEQKLIYLGCIEEENATQTIQPSLNQETLSEIITMVFAKPITQTGKHLEVATIVEAFNQLYQIEPPYLIESLKNLFLNQQA